MASYLGPSDADAVQARAQMGVLQADYERLVDLMTPIVLAAAQVVRLGRLDPWLLDLLARAVDAYEAALRHASRDAS